MFDADGPKAKATSRAFFDQVIAEKGMIAGYHFGFPNVGTCRRTATVTRRPRQGLTPPG